jgi:hypothetical protein
MIAVAAFTGIRRNEILALRRDRDIALGGPRSAPQAIDNKQDGVG